MSQQVVKHVSKHTYFQEHPCPLFVNKQDQFDEGGSKQPIHPNEQHPVCHQYLMLSLLQVVPDQILWVRSRRELNLTKSPPIYDSLYLAFWNPPCSPSHSLFSQPSQFQLKISQHFSWWLKMTKATPMKLQGAILKQLLYLERIRSCSAICSLKLVVMWSQSSSSKEVAVDSVFDVFFGDLEVSNLLSRMVSSQRFLNESLSYFVSQAKMTASKYSLNLL